jgi:hypothetical protein
MDLNFQLLDCYMEAYQHVVDRDEKRLMAQTITNLIHQRPRFDFQANYFIRCYRLECMCLRTHSQLVKAILDKQVSHSLCDRGYSISTLYILHSLFKSANGCKFLARWFLS